MAAVSVRFQQTPNPNAGKFTVDRKVVEGSASKSFYSAQQASAEPIAAALFELDGVASLFMVDDFITVMKAPETSWTELTPAVIATIEKQMK